MLINLQLVAFATLLPTIFCQRLSTDKQTGSQPELNLSTLTSHQSPPHPIALRLPTNLTSLPTTDWTFTPPRWFLGTWYLTHTNSAQYISWRNLQWTLSPLDANTYNDSLNDVTSFQLFNDTSNTIYGIYGISTPVTIQGTPQPDYYIFNPTGPLAAGKLEYERVAWGYDREGVAYFVLWETSRAFSTGSRGDGGPSEETVGLIRDAVEKEGNEVLIKLVEGVERLVQDGGRDGERFEICNGTCRMNAYIPTEV